MADSSNDNANHSVLPTNSSENDDNDIDIYMSDGSSSFGDESEHLADEESGTQPYLFEPEADESDEIPESPQADHLQRLGNTDWCLCDNCFLMQTESESQCCQEIPKITTKLEDFPHLHCITEHPGFSSVCLDQYVLETAYYVYRQSHHREMEESNKRHRYVAYRQLVRWCWGWLGKNIRVPLPSCAVNLIRQTFPCDNDNYVGFNPV